VLQKETVANDCTQCIFCSGFNKRDFNMSRNPKLLGSSANVASTEWRRTPGPLFIKVNSVLSSVSLSDVLPRLGRGSGHVQNTNGSFLCTKSGTSPGNTTARWWERREYWTMLNEYWNAWFVSVLLRSATSRCSDVCTCVALHP
jgi:hypothetical protein